jgi:hypothetical protein
MRFFAQTVPELNSPKLSAEVTGRLRELSPTLQHFASSEGKSLKVAKQA